MKKNNLFLTFTFICLAIMVAFAGAFSTMAAAPMGVRAAGAAETTKLFNEDTGAYAVARDAITKGAIFNFFDHDWLVVNVNDEANVATFWMVDPYTQYIFNKPAISYATQNENNTWSNGYTSATWKIDADHEVSLTESKIRAFLRAEAATMIDGKAYKDKVVAGYVAGANTVNEECVSAPENAYFQKNSSGTLGDHYALYEGDEDNKNFTAKYDLTNEDRLWLPSYDEIKNDGVWGLDNSIRNYNVTEYGNIAWLRSAMPESKDGCTYNFKAATVGYCPSFTVQNPDGSEENRTNPESLFVLDVDQTAAVRPAIHLNLAETPATDPTNPDNPGKDSGNKGGWFTDDMMKVFFIVICVLGVVGIILVIVAVVRKARERKRAQN